MLDVDLHAEKRIRTPDIIPKMLLIIYCLNTCYNWMKRSQESFLKR